jgi:hypothetical protein
MAVLLGDDVKRHLLLTIVDGFHYRYLVQTGIFDHLLKASDKIVVCGTESVLDLLHARGDARLILTRLPTSALSIGGALHLFLRSCANPRLSETLNVKAEQQRTNAPWRYRLRRWLSAVTEALGVDPSHWLEWVWHNESVDQLLRDHAISLVVLSTPGQKLDDLPYLEAAHRQGVRTISPVYSWDNLTAKGPFVIPPDELVVWNEVMKQEACHFHGYAPENVFVGGVPVFDPYIEILAEAADASSRREFLTRLGLDPSKRLITLTTIPPIYYGPSHRDLAIILKRWMASGQLPGTSLLIRPHPQDSTDYHDLAGPDVVLDSYGSEPNADARRWKPAEDNTRHLGRTMAFSDVVINIASTITVDAACFDTPAINIAFDIKPRGDEYVGSVARYYRYTHYRLVVETGAAALVDGPDALLAALKGYLADASQGREGRATLVRNQVGDLDGQAWRRTADAILGAWSR